MPDWYTARRVSETVYGFKTLIEEGSDHVLGAHLVGPHTDEVINLFALAIRQNLTAEHLKQTIFAYPTAASDTGSLGKNCSDHGFYHHLPALRHGKDRDDANRRLPVFL